MAITTRSFIFFILGGFVFAFSPIMFTVGGCLVRTIPGYIFLFPMPSFSGGNPDSFLAFIFPFILPSLFLLSAISFFLEEWRFYSVCLSSILAWHIGILLFFETVAAILVPISIFLTARVLIANHNILCNSGFENKREM